MPADLVIGLDSSTTATKATAWDRDGRLVATGRAPVPMQTPHPGWFEQDPEDWWGSTKAALRQLTAQVDPTRIAALAISNQRETFGLFAADGTPVRPGTVWLDERATAQSDALAAAFGADRLRAISGKPADVILPINRMIWLQEHEPDAFAAARHYADVHCYLTFRLAGHWTTSRASADPSGMLDVQQGVWSGALLQAAGVPAHLMPALASPGEVIGRVTPRAAAETGLAAGTQIVAGGGDGQCAATGAGAVEPSVAYMNLGTAAVSGVYSAAYGHDQAFRTETAVADGGYIFETVLRAGTFLIDWFAREFADAATGDLAACLARLESEAAGSPIGAGGVIVLPFWQGSMTPHWDARARGIIAGLSGSSRRGDVYRALLEGIALDQAYALVRATGAFGGHIARIVAIGGGAASDLFCRIIADATGVPVARARVAEASALGAAMCAARGAAWYPTLRAAAQGMSQRDLSVIQPDPAGVARYRNLRAIYDDLWPTLSQWNARLWSFAHERPA
ncbi:MAG: xylulokinase [Gemmobacter sp.]